MFKKISIITAILTLIVFTKFSYSQDMAIAYYSAPYVPYNETVIYEPMPAIATAPLAAPETDVAVAAMDYDTYTYYTPTSYTRTYYHRVPHDVTYSINPNDNVIRDFRYYGITTSGGNTERTNRPIRDFRRELW